MKLSSAPPILKHGGGGSDVWEKFPNNIVFLFESVPYLSWKVSETLMLLVSFHLSAGKQKVMEQLFSCEICFGCVRFRKSFVPVLQGFNSSCSRKCQNLANPKFLVLLSFKKWLSKSDNFHWYKLIYHTTSNFCLLAEKCVLRHNRAQDDEEREKEETGVLPESVLQGLEPRHHGRLQ